MWGCVSASFMAEAIGMPRALPAEMGEEAAMRHAAIAEMMRAECVKG